MRFTSRYRRWAMWILGTLIGLGAIWIGVTGLLAKQELGDISTRLQKVRLLVAQGRVEDARKVAADIPAMSARAHRLTTGPAWWVASSLPYAGSPLEVVREVTDVQKQVGETAIPALLRAADAVNPNTLRASGSQVRLAPLEHARPDLSSADAALHAAQRRLADDHASSWLGAINASRSQYGQDLNVIAGYVDAANRAAKILPQMLGSSGKRTYFIALQNEAEMRGTGGLPGAFTIATALDGKVTFTKFESDSLLLPDKTKQLIDTGLDFGTEYDGLFGASNPTSSYVDSNVSPNFPYAAQIWAAMWQKVSGQRVDGVLAVDPTALSYFLQAVGPAPLAGGGVITAQNVVPLTEQLEYSIFSDNAQRKQFLVSVIKASAKRLTSGNGTAQAIVRAASRAGSERRLLVWSRDPAIERLLAQTTYAGQIPTTTAPFAAAIVNNAAAGKLDYYLKRSISYSSTGCGLSRDVLVEITLTNDAPASGLPPYVTTRLDPNPPANAKPGDNRTILDYYGTTGGSLVSIRIDGKFATASVAKAFGHPVYRFDLELPRGATRTIDLHLTEPGKGAPEIWSQPGVTPLSVKEFSQRC